ncbi:hypothetical protein [Loktanella sp. Alg231-35]|uniref:hypothetical protein n=1 Tax=Loktanella sp. Alg231-35 TaxID=1922220 RepID=UPI000D5532AA|nr:hypothetical protein [Loktanella sp. Alg231-35]
MTKHDLKLGFGNANTRNHRVEEALQAAEAGDMAPFRKLLEALRPPFTKPDGLEDYEGPAPAGAAPILSVALARCGEAQNPPDLPVSAAGPGHASELVCEI